MDSVRKETPVVSAMIQRQETDAFRDEKDSRPLLHQKRWHRLTGKFPQQVQAAEGKFLVEQEVRFRADICIGGSNYWHPPVCLNHKSESGCITTSSGCDRYEETDRCAVGAESLQECFGLFSLACRFRMKDETQLR